MFPDYRNDICEFLARACNQKMLVKPLIHKALIIKSYFVFFLPEKPEELEDELAEEPRELVSDSLDTLC